MNTATRSPPGKRRNSTTRLVVRAELESIAAHPDHCLNFNPKSRPGRRRPGDPRRTQRNPRRRPAMGRTLVRGQSRPRRLPAQQRRHTAHTGRRRDQRQHLRTSPVEELAWENPSASAQQVQLAVDRCFGAVCNKTASTTAKPRVKILLAENGTGVSEIEYPNPPKATWSAPPSTGTAGSPNVIGVGAVRFDNGSAPEPYSSRGPVTHYFGPVERHGAGAGALPAQPISKPDLVATDCGRPPSSSRPNPAPVVSAGPRPAGAPRRRRGRPRAAGRSGGDAGSGRLAALIATARPMPPFGVDEVGAGLIDAYGAVDEIALPPKVTFPEPALLTRNRSPTIAFAANRPGQLLLFTRRRCGAPLLLPVHARHPLPDGEHRPARQCRRPQRQGGAGSERISGSTLSRRGPSSSFTPARTCASTGAARV